MNFFGSKKDKTILPYIFEDLTEGLEPMRPPQPPKKPTFWKYWKSSWKLVIFKKVGFLGGQRGGLWFLTLQNDFIYHCLLIFLFEAQKSHFIQKISIWKYGFLNFSGALGGPPVKFFSKNGSKPSTIPRIKKSLTFGPQKITLKLIYGRFPIGGPVSIRVKKKFLVTYSILMWSRVSMHCAQRRIY